MAGLVQYGLATRWATRPMPRPQVLPGRVVGGTYINDSFTAANGTAWNSTYWVQAVATAGASSTVQTNKGRLNAGTVTAYGGKMGMRGAVGAVADTDISGTFTDVNFNTTDGNLQIFARTDSAFAATNCYQLAVTPGLGFARVAKVVGGSWTQLGSNMVHTFTDGVVWGFRFQVIGTAIRARVWTGAEPSTWEVDTTDSAITAAGFFGLYCGGGSLTSAQVDVDDLVVTNGEAPAVVAYTGDSDVLAVTATCTATGTAASGGALVTYINDPFTGTNGAAWNAAYWTAAITSTGSSATIQGNQGRLNTGSLTGGNGKHAMRYSGAAVADVDISFAFTFVNCTTVDGTLQLVVRANTALAWQNEYVVIFLPGSAQALVQKNVSSANTNLGTISISMAQGSVYGCRFQVIGTAIRCRVWSGAEPGTWGVDTTDSSITSAAYFGLMAQNVSTAGFLVDINDFLATNGGSPVTAALPMIMLPESQAVRRAANW